MYSIKTRIKNLHKSTVIVDAHNDMPTHINKKRKSGERKVIERHFLSDIKAGGVKVIVASIFVSDVSNAYLDAHEQLDALIDDIQESTNHLMLCGNYKDINNAIQQDKIAIIPGFEGIEPIEDKLDLLEDFHRRGIRVNGICWSRKNLASDGCGYEKNNPKDSCGLTDFGIEIVKESKRLGMLVDLTHISEKGFWDIIQTSNQPIIASHTNCRSIFDINRNFSDNQIIAIAQKGGVIGINGVNCIAAPVERDQDITVLADHIDHIKKIAGINAIGIGLDLFPYFDESYHEMTIVQDGHTRFLRDLIKSYQNLTQLTEILLDRGYTDDDVRKVLGENFMRVFKQIFN
ncbi:MAG: membrane dipeptidase [Eubacteriales bacterium]|nr:membrane dipeptidase [Eubacteriales bacterium]